MVPQHVAHTRSQNWSMSWHGNKDRVSHQLSPPSSRLKRITRQHGRVARSTTGKTPPGRNSHVIKPTPTNIPQLQYKGAQGVHLKLEHQARASGGTSREKAQYSVVTLITFATLRQLWDSLRDSHDLLFQPLQGSGVQALRSSTEGTSKKHARRAGLCTGLTLDG